MRCVLLICALLVVSACEYERPMPPDATRAATLSAHLLAHHELSWGPAVTILEPRVVDADGAQWWQVLYAPGADGQPRRVEVHAESGWARLVPADRALAPEHHAMGMQGEVIHALPYGSAVLVLELRATEPGIDEIVLRLNRRAKAANEVPAFSKRSRRGGDDIVYGWQGDGGTQVDDRLRHWIERDCPEVAVVDWVDLLND